MSPKLRKQQALWTLLGQVTSAQRWHNGLLSRLKVLGYHSQYLICIHDQFVNKLKEIEEGIRKDMKEL